MRTPKDNWSVLLGSNRSDEPLKYLAAMLFQSASFRRLVLGGKCDFISSARRTTIHIYFLIQLKFLSR